MAARLHSLRWMLNKHAKLGGKLTKLADTIFASVGMMLLCASASFGQQVKTDYDRGADFSQYKTYSWEKVQTQNPLWVSRIKQAVNADLASKGWTPVISGGDVAIVAMDMTKNHQTVDTYYDGFGGGWRWGGGFGDATTSVDTYKVGTLVIDIGCGWRKAVPAQGITVIGQSCPTRRERGQEPSLSGSPGRLAGRGDDSWPCPPASVQVPQ